MRWIAVLAFITTLLAGPADARIDAPEDESKPKLVKLYLVMPCDALRDSAMYQSLLLRHAYNHLVECREKAKVSTHKYRHLRCIYVEMQWQFIYDHLASVHKAGELMCNDDGTPKNPKYEIHF